MPNVLDRHGAVVYRCSSDAEACRWWRREGEPGDRLEDTGELISDVAKQLRLED